MPPTAPPLHPGRLLARSSLSLPSRRALTCAHTHTHTAVGRSLPSALPCCRSESVIVNNFFSSVDGQLELLGQATLDSSVSSMGALHALRPRLTHFHQLLFEPLEVGWAGQAWRGGREGCSLALGSRGPGIEPPLCLQLEPLRTTCGILAPPLGNTRLHVVKLLASALSANDAALTQELLALDVPNTMLVRRQGSGHGVGWVGPLGPLHAS